MRKAGPRIPAPIDAAEDGTIIETSPASVALARELARRLVGQGGAALIVDYGPERSGVGDTLQAVERHVFADPWTRPGARDLTAHVDFSALRMAAEREGACSFGPLGQGAWLKELGIDIRAALLAKARPEKAGDIEAARDRLTAPEQMGELFKAMAITAPSWPEPAGFQ